MSYVIFNIQTEKLFKKPHHFSGAMYDTERGAKGMATRLNKKAGSEDWMVITTEDYNALPVKMKKVRNLMSGTEIEIAEDTPLCCDPSSETYWSM